MDGVIDEKKLSVLETCALGWVKEAVSMRVLAKEMTAAGLDGFEIMWVVGSMVLLAFPDENSRQRLLSQDVLSTWLGRLEEWSASAEYASQRAWLSISGLPIHLWSEGSFRNIAGKGDADFAFTEIRSREGLDIVHPSVSISERDSLGVKVVGDCESAEKYGRVVGVNGECAPSTTILGLAGAAAAPVIGSTHGGARKVKSVNTLVEALESPAQKRVIAADRSRRGRGRLAKESKWESVFS
ncbi:hypothetical protein V6N11_020578 [Hibiscus sabdariffa]|uniref:DUF4283 domain-containing protein n=1 Tax=Hibiscus sabdariffa TaxID=183260 RepID=A0ABR2Q8W1_9ROSI